MTFKQRFIFIPHGYVGWLAQLDDSCSQGPPTKCYYVVAVAEPI